MKSGIVFTGSKGSPISRSYIARAMKEVAEQCGIDPAMVFPHNLRHYFARSFLDCGNPLSDLADILGHKSIDTTRRYLRTSAETKQKQLAKLKIIPNWQRNYGYSQEKNNVTTCKIEYKTKLAQFERIGLFLHKYVDMEFPLGRE
ncbi:tyrosine-type recombinase/integrase [Lysinibacillus sp. MHQ-1]|nr:tyrosine-type recombinase/integrase [Lysinibacillus sp. MHQ-1]